MRGIILVCVQKDVGVRVNETWKDYFAAEVDVVLRQRAREVGGPALVKVGNGTRFGVDLDRNIFEEGFTDGIKEEGCMDSENLWLIQTVTGRHG